MMSSRSNISMLFLSLFMLLVGSVNAGDTSSSAATTTAASTTTTAAATTTTKAAVTTTTTVKPTLTTPAVPTKSVTDEVCYEPEEETSTYKPSVPTTFTKVPGGSGPAPTDSAPKPSGTLVTSGGRAVVPGLALGLLAAVAVVCCSIRFGREMKLTFPALNAQFRPIDDKDGRKGGRAGEFSVIYLNSGRRRLLAGAVSHVPLMTVSLAPSAVIITTKFTQNLHAT